MRTTYNILLLIAAAAWFSLSGSSGMACAPDYSLPGSLLISTHLFWLYPLSLIVSEWMISRKSMRNFYGSTKITQRLVELSTIFVLTNGDFGWIIAIELAFIAFEGFNLPPGFRGGIERGGLRGGHPIWRTIRLVDRETARFLLISVCVMLVSAGPSIIAAARFQLLAVLLIMKSIQVRRQICGHSAGCLIDKLNAIIMAAAIALIGAINWGAAIFLSSTF